MATITSFTGNVPQQYETYLGPLFFEPYAIDLAERIGKKHYDAALELACGTGRVTQHLVHKVAANGKLYATDLNADMLTVAKEKIQNERIVWQVADAQNLPYENDSFDLVVCQYGVMFFPDKLKAFREAHRVLKQECSFLFNTWDDAKYNAVAMTTKEVLYELFPAMPPAFFERGPYSFFDLYQIKQLVQDAGFTSIAIEIVAKTSIAPSPEEVIKGFLEGTPLNAYLQEQQIPFDEVKQKVRDLLVQRYGESNLQLPMQALVCEAKKG